jgi:inosine-uridine nucleoside N-ribohydrolase
MDLMMSSQKKAVILDTDIGLDIDDTWALGMLLKSPELDVKLITTVNHDTTLKAKLIAKFLQEVNRDDIPIGIGVRTRGPKGPLRKWVKHYDLSQYNGHIFENAAEAIVKTIKNLREPVLVIGIGPLGNIAAALKQESEITNNSRFIGMHGAINKYYGGFTEIGAEYNVAQDIEACRTVFNSKWYKTITPLDTCGKVKISGRHFKRIMESSDHLISLLKEQTVLWAKSRGFYKKMTSERSTSPLFDTVAIYLAYSEELLDIKPLKIVVTDEGLTKEDENGSLIKCALNWKDLSAFEDHLTKRLLK